MEQAAQAMEASHRAALEKIRAEHELSLEHE
jgi:hypothetical protein